MGMLTNNNGEMMGYIYIYIYIYTKHWTNNNENKVFFSSSETYIMQYGTKNYYNVLFRNFRNNM